MNNTMEPQIGALVPFVDKSLSQAEILPGLTPYIEHMFTPPHEWADGVFRTPLCCVSDYLRQNGVALANIRAGLLTYLGLNSVKLGFPLSVVLTADDPAVAGHLVHMCKMIAPDQCFREVHELKPEDLYKDQVFFKDKVLICHDFSTIKKAMSDLSNLITVGYSERQAPSQSKFGSGIQKFCARHPRALIGIETSSNMNLINHPSIIKIPVDNFGRHDEISQNLFSNSTISPEITESRTIATIFERLRKNSVSIPDVYSDHIVQAVFQQKPKHLRSKLELIRKVISLCTIINNPPLISQTELLSKMIGVKQEYLYQKLDEKNNRDVKYLGTVNTMDS